MGCLLFISTICLEAGRAALNVVNAVRETFLFRNHPVASSKISRFMRGSLSARGSVSNIEIHIKLCAYGESWRKATVLAGKLEIIIFE
jgi:hypothetical protein